MTDDITVKKFGVFHIFPFSLESEIEFSEELFNSLAKNSEINGILRMKHETEAISKNLVTHTNWCNDITEYFETNKRIFSPYYFSQEKNFRIFLPDIELIDTSGDHRKISINAVIDKRGVVIINFFVDYNYDTPISAEKVLEELYAPHLGKRIIIKENGNAKEMNFEEAFFHYFKKIKDIVLRNAVKSKEDNLRLSLEDLRNYYEPYAFTIIDDYLYGGGPTRIDERNIHGFLPILLWEEVGQIRDYRKETIERLYTNVSHKNRYLTLLSRESTLLIDNDVTTPVNSYDVISYLVNIELLMLQKLVLQLYDHKVDVMLMRLRNQKISPSIIVDFREKVQKDLEDLFDIRIKKYQRGRDIVDIGQEILKLKDFSQEVLGKINTLDNLIALKHNLYIERITVVLTLLGIIIVTFDPVLSIIPEIYKKWVYGFYIGAILLASLYYYIRIKRV